MTGRWRYRLERARARWRRWTGAYVDFGEWDA